MSQTGLTVETTYIVGHNCVLEASPIIGRGVEVHCLGDLHHHELAHAEHECEAHGERRQISPLRVFFHYLIKFNFIIFEEKQTVANVKTEN